MLAVSGNQPSLTCILCMLNHYDYSIIVLWVHSPLSFLGTATEDYIGIELKSLKVSYFLSSFAFPHYNVYSGYHCCLYLVVVY